MPWLQQALITEREFRGVMRRSMHDSFTLKGETLSYSTDETYRYVTQDIYTTEDMVTVTRTQSCLVDF